MRFACYEILLLFVHAFYSSHFSEIEIETPRQLAEARLWTLSFAFSECCSHEVYVAWDFPPAPTVSLVVVVFVFLFVSVSANRDVDSLVSNGNVGDNGDDNDESEGLGNNK